MQRTCPICKSKSQSYILHRQTFVLPAGHILPDWYNLVACIKCGFVYADTAASQDIYDKYYAEMSKYDVNYGCDDNLLYIDRAAWINTYIGNKTDSIIDIGCGNGQLLLELQKLGFSDLTGLDPSEKCIMNLQKKGINGIISSIFSASTRKKYNCAILSGVLEHVYDIAGLMDTMKQMIKSQGLLLVFVPDSSRYQDYDSIPYDYFNIEHINHFDETSLLNLGFQHGFSMISFLKTTITLSQTTQPVIFCAYENKAKPPVNSYLYSRDCIVDYIEHTKKNRKINQIINKMIDMKEEIVVWGAGNFTSRLLATSELGKCNIVFFVDNDIHKQGTLLCSRMVHAPIMIKSLAKNATILITAAVFQKEIIEEIKKMGLNNKTIVLNN